jgi:hypothetical protein
MSALKHLFRRLTRRAVPVVQLGQAPVQIVGRDPLTESKADDIFLDNQLLALHLLTTNPHSATATTVFGERTRGYCLKITQNSGLVY